MPNCSCGVLTKCSCSFLKKIVEGDHLKKLIQFVTGLNKSDEQVKINTLSIDLLFTFNRVYHMFQQIERQNFIIHSQPAQISSRMIVKYSVNSVLSRFSRFYTKERF